MFTTAVSVIVALAPLVVAVLEAIGGHRSRERATRNALAQVEVAELNRGMSAVDKLYQRP